MADDDNPQFGQRGADASYWELRRKERQNERDADLPPESEETRLFKIYSEAREHAKSLSSPIDAIFQNTFAKKQFLYRVGITTIAGKTLDECHPGTIGRAYQDLQAEAEKFLNPGTRSF